MCIGKIASTLLLIIACLSISGENKVLGQDQTNTTQNPSQSGLQGVAPASYSNSCSLVDPQYNLEVMAQGPCGTTFTEIALYSAPTVKLYVRYGQKVTTEGDKIIADYKSESDSAYKTITLSPPYQGGTYYVAIANCGGEPASFSLRFGVAIADYFGPFIKNVSVKGKKLLVSGCGFDTEAVILLNDEQQPTQFMDRYEMPTLMSKKAFKRISSGESVSLQVQGANGRKSEPFMFTLPVQ
jgi:hypothetical protein